MSFLNFGDLDARQLCKWLWLLCFGIYFMRYFSQGVAIYEGAPALAKLKFYGSMFYFKFVDPIVILFAIKFAFELLLKFYERIGHKNGQDNL